jgi:putative oxidoreductase
MLRVLLKTDNSVALFFSRLALGIVMFPHGAQKMLGWYGGSGYEKTIELFTTKMNFPLGLVIVFLIAEFVGSICLIAGFFTRVFAFAIGASLALCAYMNHLKNGFFMNWFGTQSGEGFEFHILAVGIALALVIGGGGAFSLDRAFAGKK